jgi:hypothetical protein
MGPSLENPLDRPLNDTGTRARAALGWILGLTARDFLEDPLGLTLSNLGPELGESRAQGADFCLVVSSAKSCSAVHSETLMGQAQLILGPVLGEVLGKCLTTETVPGEALGQSQNSTKLGTGLTLGDVTGDPLGPTLSEHWDQSRGSTWCGLTRVHSKRIHGTGCGTDLEKLVQADFCLVGEEARLGCTETYGDGHGLILGPVLGKYWGGLWQPLGLY